MSMSSSEWEADYLVRWAGERARVRSIRYAINALSVLILGTLFYFLLVRETWNYELIALSFFFIFTRLSGFIVFRRYLVPDVLVALRDGNPEQQSAAYLVIDANRASLLGDLRRERLESSKPEALAALDLEEIKAWKQLDDVAWWSRFAQRWLIVWCIVAVAIVTLLISLW